MTKQEFLSKLEDLLSELPAEDREDALRFYQEYLEDAGEENEQSALAELGDVEQLAEQIRQACCANKVEQPQPEQQQPEQPKQEPHRWPAPVQYLRPNSSDYTEYRRQRSKDTASDTSATSEPVQPKCKPTKDTPNTATIIILILIAIFTFPLWIGFIGTIFGLFVGFGVAALVSVVCAVVALFSIASVGIGGLLVFGGCVFVAGISLVVLAGIGWLVVRFGVPLIRFIVNCAKKLASAVNG